MDPVLLVLPFVFVLSSLALLTYAGSLPLSLEPYLAFWAECHDACTLATYAFFVTAMWLLAHFRVIPHLRLREFSPQLA